MKRTGEQRKCGIINSVQEEEKNGTWCLKVEYYCDFGYHHHNAKSSDHDRNVSETIGTISLVHYKTYSCIMVFL